MERTVIGNTGLEVFRMGFGGIPIQRVGEAQAVETVRHAVERGVDFIDTSRMYTNSEHRIGMALQGLRKPVILASKTPSRTHDGVLSDLEESLRQLRRGTIEIYQLHLVRDDADYEKAIAPGGALDALRAARDAGKIGHIGITTHSLDLAERIIDEGLFQTIMVCFSFLEPDAEHRIFPRAREKGIGVIAMKSFSGGVIERTDLALKYALSRSDVVLIPGVEDIEKFDRNWSVFESGEYTLTEADLAEIESVRRAFDKNFCRRCDYCQPCTEGISIQTVLGIPSAVNRFGPAILEKDFFAHAIDLARNCSECRECVERCPYDLPIPELIQENLAWLDERL